MQRIKGTNRGSETGKEKERRNMKTMIMIGKRNTNRTEAKGRVGAAEVKAGEATGADVVKKQEQERISRNKRRSSKSLQRRM